MAEHTPGPYRIFQAKGPPYLVAQGAGWKRVATIKEQEDAGETLANARLFAAAPDMLKALEFASDCLSMSSCRGAILAAIDKAKGAAS